MAIHFLYIYYEKSTEGYCTYNEVKISVNANIYCVVFVSVVAFLFSYIVDSLVNNLYRVEAKERKEDDLNKFFSSTTKKIYNFKKDLDNPTKGSKSEYTYYSSILTLICLNVFFVYYTILKGNLRGTSWQYQYVVACFVQLLLDVLLFGTIECVYINVILPLSVKPDIQIAQKLLDDYLIDVEFYRFIKDIDEHNLLELERDPKSTEINIIHKISTFIRIITFVPFELQRLFIRFIQPFVFGGIVLGYQSIGALYMSIMIVIFVVLTVIIYRRYANNAKVEPVGN